MSDEQKAGSFTIAGIVNSAFACEIFLKTLLTTSGYTQKPHGHKLLCLWETLEKENPSLSNKIKLSIQSSFYSEDIQLLDNLLNIDTISDAFYHWRYIFEKDKSTKLCMNRVFIRNFWLFLE